MKNKFFATLLTATLVTSFALSGCQSNTATNLSTASQQESNTQTETSSKKRYYKRVSVHDPSIIKADGSYYIFGSHRAWAKSDDLISWENISTNINTEYKTMFTDLWENYCKTDSNPDIQGNMWAPDVIYNKDMKKYCMYMSINGDEWNSAIVLLTADKVTGPYTYVGPVVFSGFNTTTHPASYTDVYQVLGKNADLSRYQSTKDTKLNAIDPCVKYDENGDLWMAFGSWFGGIYMLKLDPKTGLRDYSVSYETKENVSDAYYGYKIAGGHEVSGEGAYIIHTNGYYYLFLSYGGLTASGGYQMRVFRSKEITGPYVDQNGNSSIYTSSANNLFLKIGIRLMSSYSWSGSSEIRVAQGHNSAFVDEDGRIFLVYHTRFSNRGEEHQVRTQQLFVNEDGWLVSAPYEYAEESLSPSGYAKEEYIGDYEFITHLPTAYFQASGTGDVGIVKAITITLKEDGSITSEDDSISGTWTVKENTPNVSLSIDGTTYKGYFLKMPNESSQKEVMTFTALGDNMCIWGSKQ